VGSVNNVDLLVKYFESDIELYSDVSIHLNELIVLQLLLYRPSERSLCSHPHPYKILAAEECQTPLPSNRHHRRCGDCLEGKGEN